MAVKLIKDMTLIELLYFLSEKGAAWQRRGQAIEALKILETYLPRETFIDVSVAFDHYCNGFEGSGEFYAIINGLIKHIVQEECILYNNYKVKK